MNHSKLLSQKLILDPEQTQKLRVIALLFIGVVAVSFAAIFIKWSEYEISANATVFNRLWSATIILGCWNSLNFVSLKLSNQQSHQQSGENSPYTKTVIFLLLILGFTYLGFQFLWAWSITQTSIAISTVLHNLTPLFTTLTAWLLFHKHFETKFLMGMVIAMLV